MLTEGVPCTSTIFSTSTLKFRWLNRMPKMHWNIYRDMPDFSESSVPIRWIWFCRWISPKLSRICHHIPQFSVKPATMVTVQPTGYACTCKSCLYPAEDG